MKAIAAVLVVGMCATARADDLAARVRKAVERSTLDQPGTKPFHLKAELAPSMARDAASGRTGEVEIWWAGPGKWRREVRSPEFHQIEIVDGGRDWQKNEGDYFPEWLREMAVALVRPVPDIDELLMRLKTAEVMIVPDGTNSTHCSWVVMGSDGVVSKGIGAGIYLRGDGSYRSGGEVGWWASLSEVSDFRGRTIARKVEGGGVGPGVTATVTVLEDLKSVPPGFLDAAAGGSDPILQTRVVDERSERKNLLPQEAVPWPELAQGPLEGALMAEVVIDREGKIREIGTLLSDNPGLSDTARAWIGKMRFKPDLVNGVPAQVVTTITMPFKTVRPAGVENFESAKTYLDRARRLGFPAAAGGAPYVLHAEFTARGSSGQVETGSYTDTWVSDSQWRREATLAKSRFVRSRNGDKRYLVGEGPDEALLRIVLKEMEPIPATDVWYEAEWRMKHDTVDGIATVRAASGYETPEGVLDPEARAFWFDETGQMVKSHGYKLETRRLEFQDFNGMQVARRVDVFSGGKLAMSIKVTELGPAGPVDPGMFVVKGHEWVRQFTEEVR